MSDLVFGAKQPYEEYYIYFDFVNDIAGEDSVDTYTIVIEDSDDNDVTDDLTDSGENYAEGTRVYVWIKGGSSGMTYTITCKIVTAVNAEKFESDADITVTEI